MIDNYIPALNECVAEVGDAQATGRSSNYANDMFGLAVRRGRTARV